MLSDFISSEVFYAGNILNFLGTTCWQEITKMISNSVLYNCA